MAEAAVETAASGCHPITEHAPPTPGTAKHLLELEASQDDNFLEV